MTNLFFSVPVSNQLELHRMTKLFVRLLCVSCVFVFVFMAFSPAAHAQAIDIGSGTLDNDRVIAPRWTRINFEPTTEGEHKISINSDNSADIRFSVFRIIDANDNVRIGTSSSSLTVAEWTGTLNTTEQYYLGVWAASGSGNYTATIEAQTLVDIPVTVASIGQGIVDADRIEGPRWVRHTFGSLAAGIHTITVSWDSDADVRYKVFEADGSQISPTIQGTSPNAWSGELEANTQYSISIWSTDGVANYDAMIDATASISIASQPIDRVVTEGDDVTFSVEATGSGTLSYQWFANNLPLNGETADSLTIFATSLLEDGTIYNVEISNNHETVASEYATLTVNEPLALGLFSQVADNSTWILDGPAPTLDYHADLNTDAWGKVLLKVGDLLLVGGDFEGIKPNRDATPTARPFLAALDAVSGQPIASFQVPGEVDSVVRALAIAPNGEQVYVGGDFGLLALDATTGALEFAISVTKGDGDGRVFDIAVAGSQLYIGGDFNKVNNTYRANLARLSLNGDLDTQWKSHVTHGYNNGRAAPVQSLAVSVSGDTVYVGGNFRFINGTPVSTTPQNNRISMLSVSALDGSVLPERFAANVGLSRLGLTAFDIVVTEFYVIIAWGGPNCLTFHSLDGSVLVQYDGTGDTQALQVVGNHVFVGHHGEYFGSWIEPVPQEAVVSLSPFVVDSFKIHSFRIDDPTFLYEQSWQIRGAFGIWGIAADEDSLWVAGQISHAGSNGRRVDGLARFPAL